MQIGHAMLKTGLAALALIAGTTLRAQEQVGEVVLFVNKTYVYHEVTDAGRSTRELIEGNISVHHTDVLEAGDDGELRIEMDDADELMIIHAGRLALVDGPGLKKLARVEKGLLRVEGSEQYYAVATNQASIQRTGTVYEVIAEARESRIYVYEGHVEVTSRDPCFPEPVVVGPGQWVRVREGEPIEKPPKIFIVDPKPGGPGTGSPECIHSACRPSLGPVNPRPPVVTPMVQTPPPLHPPSRR